MNDIPGLPLSSLEANVYRVPESKNPGALPPASQEEFSAALKLRHELTARLSNKILLAFQQTLHRLLPAGARVLRQMPATCNAGLGSRENYAAHAWTNRATGEQSRAALASQQQTTGKIPSREPDHSTQWPSNSPGQTPGTQSFVQNSHRGTPPPAQQQELHNTPPGEPDHSTQWPSSPHGQTPGTQSFVQNSHRGTPPPAQQQELHNTPPGEPDHSTQWPSSPHGQTPGTQSFVQNSHRGTPPPAQQQELHNTPPGEPDQSPQIPSKASAPIPDNAPRFSTNTQSSTYDPPSPNSDAADTEPAPEQADNNIPPTEQSKGQEPSTANAQQPASRPRNLGPDRPNTDPSTTQQQASTRRRTSRTPGTGQTRPIAQFPEQGDAGLQRETRTVRPYTHDARAAATGTPDTRQAAANAQSDGRTEAPVLTALATPGSTPDSGQPPTVEVPRTPASHAARFAGQVSVVAERILVSSPDAGHGEEVRIQLRQSILDGSGIRIFREAGELNIIFIAPTEAAQRFLAENQERFQAIIGERLRDDKIRIVVESATDRETSSEDNEGRSRQRYVPPDDPTLPE